VSTVDDRDGKVQRVLDVVRIAIARGSYADMSDLEVAFGDRAEFVPVDLDGTTAETVKALQGCHALVVALHRLDRSLLGALAGTISVVGRSGIGLDSIDLDAAQDAGIAVIHQPDYGSREVATHALALIMAVHRRIVESDRLARSGWHGRAAVGDIGALEQMRAGVVGAGRIGRHLIEMLRPLVGEILVFDPYATAIPDGVRHVTVLQDLLRECSIVSLHLPLTGETRDLIGRAELELLGPGGILVNVSRGGLVNETALADALAQGVIAGAGFDVLTQEPPPSDHVLLSAPNMILTPHTAWYSLASEHRCKHWTIGDVIAYLHSESLQGRLAVDPRR
jgi:D-3-phosphoglycerate dehydrogenase